MPSGGARVGAGRKKGRSGDVIALNQRAVIAEARKEAIDKGILPIAVMLKWMRAADAGNDDAKAMAYAHMCAPYVHPRLSTVNATAVVEHKGEDGEDIRRIAMFMMAAMREARERGVTLDLEAAAPDSKSVAPDDER